MEQQREDSSEKRVLEELIALGRREQPSGAVEILPGRIHHAVRVGEIVVRTTRSGRSDVTGQLRRAALLRGSEAEDLVVLPLQDTPIGKVQGRDVTLWPYHPQKRASTWADVIHVLKELHQTRVPLPRWDPELAARRTRKCAAVALTAILSKRGAAPRGIERVEEAIEHVLRRAATLPEDEATRETTIHGDARVANVIVSDRRRLIDLDDIRLGPRGYDLVIVDRALGEGLAWGPYGEDLSREPSWESLRAVRTLEHVGALCNRAALEPDGPWVEYAAREVLGLLEE